MTVFCRLAMLFLVSIIPMDSVIAGELHIHAHAHNDYEHERPLFDALKNQFYSVEADIWLVNSEIMVSHDQGNYKGSLKELYLDPLQAQVNEKGSVHGDGKPFYLWIDIKDSRAELRPVLHHLLEQYAMLSVFTQSEVKENPVTVILTGDRKSKEAFIQEYPVSHACRDSNTYSPDDPPANTKWLWYAVNWRNVMGEAGRTEFTPEQRENVQQMVDDIHGKGRKIRFYSLGNRILQQTALETGIGLINTDQAGKLKCISDKNGTITVQSGNG